LELYCNFNPKLTKINIRKRKPPGVDLKREIR
jgi:hypothetical protein